MRKKSKSKKELFSFAAENDSARLTILEPLTIYNANQFDEKIILNKLLKDINTLIIDFSTVSSYDSYLVLFHTSLKEYCTEKGINFIIEGMNDDMKRFLEVLESKDLNNKLSKEKSSFWYSYISGIGKNTLILIEDVRSFIEFLGDLILKILNLFIRPTQMRWQDFPLQFSRAGVNALPIVLLIVFLIGIITGYQGSLQLEQFGADIYIADLIGISITRELAPLMTAILVAGRSGSAFAAELGTMKVSEEIDALGSMGFDFMKFLVLPRVLAVMLAMPILTILADIAGVGGGLIAALLTLNITFSGYINELQIALTYYDIFSGIGKSIIFGLLVATVGCFRGMQVRGGAESVGKFTTMSVVSGVLLIILADAVFTFIFQTLGI